MGRLSRLVPRVCLQFVIGVFPDYTRLFFCSQISKDNMFLRDVLAGCRKINASESTHVIAMEIIWNNSQVKCNNKIFFYHNRVKRIELIEHIHDFRIHNLIFYNSYKICIISIKMIFLNVIT